MPKLRKNGSARRQGAIDRLLNQQALIMERITTATNNGRDRINGFAVAELTQQADAIQSIIERTEIRMWRSAR